MLQSKTALRISKRTVFLSAWVLTVALSVMPGSSQQSKPFNVMEATIADIHAAYQSKRLTTHQLVQMYMDRIDAYDKKGPALNSIITINPKALEEADQLDAALKKSGIVGPLHGIPVILKDMIDSKGMPTTEGSLVLKDYYPAQDAFVTDKLKKAGAIILAKATLSEYAMGDTYGSLFGITKNPYDPERTPGGSSGGNGASIASNFATVSVGQESLGSIRRPSTWNSIVGMRPTDGLVSRSGVWGGWPSITGSLGPMTRTVTDAAKLLDVMAGYDPEDPLTALGVDAVPASYTKFLDKNGLKGARLGILRESIGSRSEPDSEDFKKVSAAFEKALAELKAAGALVVDPIVIPNLKDLLAKRAGGPEVEKAERVYFSRSPNSKFKTRQDIIASPDFEKMRPRPKQSFLANPAGDVKAHYEYLMAREELMFNVLKVMADNKLDAIVYKSVEHQPTLIRDGLNPPYYDQRGIPGLNTFLSFVPVITVPAGWTTDNLPVGITFQGRPFAEGTLIKLAYSYEQSTHHRKPPDSVPKL